MANRQGSLLAILGKRMLGFNPSSKGCCAPPALKEAKAADTQGSEAKAVVKKTPATHVQDASCGAPSCSASASPAGSDVWHSRMMNRSTDRLPVAVIGAGPVGLAAAVHLIDKGATPLVLEAGVSVGANVLSWAHVRMFSPWQFNVDPVAGAMLEAFGWQRPIPGEYPTGGDLVERYLVPLAKLPNLGSRIRLGTRVIGISRLGLDRTKSAQRERAPFVLHVVTDGREDRVLARAVVDASGTVATPNFLGASGLPGFGERQLADRIFYGIPDVLGVHRGRYAAKRTLVIGSGHSAFNVLLDLAKLARSAPRTTVSWAIRRASLDNLFGGGGADQLPERGRLGERLRQLVASDSFMPVRGFRLSRLRQTADGIIAASDEQTLPPVDEIVAATGFRPDLAPLREVRLELDATIECPTALAPLIDPNVHSCGTVPPHGEEVLRHPEPGFYLAGMKSYGRAPNFLMLTGYEQVRSIACALTGDVEGARKVELMLPATGVCTGALLAGATACCGKLADEEAATACVRPVAPHGVPLATPREGEPAGRCCS